MSEELETLKEVISHPASWGSVTAIVGWMGNKLWRGYRHEISNIQQTQVAASAAIWKEMDERRKVEAKIFDQMREHDTKDIERYERQETSSRDRHDEIMAVIGDLRADVAGLKR